MLRGRRLGYGRSKTDLSSAGNRSRLAIADPAACFARSRISDPCQIRKHLPTAETASPLESRQPRLGVGARLNGVAEPERILLRVLDETFDLTPSGAHRAVEGTSPRSAPEQVARRDWHNDVSRRISTSTTL